jgi:hypothetical protein
MFRADFLHDASKSVQMVPNLPLPDRPGLSRYDCMRKTPMSDEQLHCQNPACGLPIEVIPGHRRRKYCDDACKMAAQPALRERAGWRERWGDLLSASLDQLRHLRITYGAALAEQIAAVLKAERDEGRKNLTEERTILLEEIMLAGEQVDFPAIATEAFELQPGVFAWSAFCGRASIEDLRLAREAVHLKLQAKNGRLKLHT